MSDPVWYRSLYWRIAFGFIALLAVLLVVQAGLFLYLTGRILSSSRTPLRLANDIADAVSFALARTPELELEPYVREQFADEFQPFLVMLNDGRVAANRPTALPPNFSRVVRSRGRGRGDFGPSPRQEFGLGRGDVGRGGRGRGDIGSEGPGRGDRIAEIAPIVVNGAQVGVAAVPANPPPIWVALREVSPTLAWIAAGLLLVGAAVMALVIFRPARQRLHALEQAAAALGAGRPDVRAVETGGDEVSSLAKTFNRMADDLATRARALAASDEARRQLLADVSHELMTPLAAIRGYTETLAMPELGLDEATRLKYLNVVDEETQKLEELIGDLLDLARVEGGGGAWAAETVKIGDLFGRVQDRHGPTIRERNIQVTAVVEPESLTVEAVPQRLEQALQNLAANALRHTPDGGRLALHASADGEVVRITVRDSGPGIPPEHLARVFDRFYKVDASRTATETPSGSGLGLSIVKAIVERHGGAIGVSNAPDGGAVFEIRLPVSRGVAS